MGTAQHALDEHEKRIGYACPARIPEYLVYASRWDAKRGFHLPTKLLHLEASAVQWGAWLPERRVMGGPMPSPFVCSALTAADLLSKLPMLFTQSRCLHPKVRLVHSLQDNRLNVGRTESRLEQPPLQKFKSTEGAGAYSSQTKTWYLSSAGFHFMP